MEVTKLVHVANNLGALPVVLSLETMPVTIRASACLLYCIVWGLALSQAPERDAFFPGQLWNDTDGNRISARGAGFLGPIDSVYYWFGQFNESKELRNDAVRALSAALQGLHAASG